MNTEFLISELNKTYFCEKCYKIYRRYEIFINSCIPIELNSFYNYKLYCSTCNNRILKFINSDFDRYIQQKGISFRLTSTTAEKILCKENIKELKIKEDLEFVKNKIKLNKSKIELSDKNIKFLNAYSEFYKNSNVSKNYYLDKIKGE